VIEIVTFHEFISSKKHEKGAIMNKIIQLYTKFDDAFIGFMRFYSIRLLRISLGLTFAWFGLLKFFSGASPAEDLAIQTIAVLSFGLIPDAVALFILALWETLIGFGLIIGRYLRLVLFLLFAQMAGTMTPLLIFPELTFTLFPAAPTLEGQYIIKNLILISSGLVIGATVRGGQISETPIEG
jgi:uncharacterized membrane protein YphA (DoxX/SURF4 family)